MVCKIGGKPLDVHVHANCQAIAIAGMIKELYPSWRVTWFEAHTQEIIERLDEHRLRIRSADLVLTQPIHRGYRDTEELSGDWVRENVRQDATLLVVPSIYFSAHNPDLGSIPLSGLPPQFNLLAAHLIAAGCRPEVALGKLLSDDLLSLDDIRDEIALALAETSRREREDCIDVPIYSFLKENCWAKPMFHIENHPLRATTAFVVNGVFQHLGLDARVPEEGHDYQPEPHFPPLPSVQRYLSEPREAGAGERDYKFIKVFGWPPLSQSVFYERVIATLSTLPRRTIESAISECTAARQFLQRLAARGSKLEGIDRWQTS